MKYNAQAKGFIISASDLDNASYAFFDALVKIRQAAGLPLVGYEHSTPLNAADHAQIAVIRAASNVGIDLGDRFGNQIDLRKYA